MHQKYKYILKNSVGIASSSNVETDNGRMLTQLCTQHSYYICVKARRWLVVYNTIRENQEATWIIKQEIVKKVLN